MRRGGDGVVDRLAAIAVGHEVDKRIELLSNGCPTPACGHSSAGAISPNERITLVSSMARTSGSDRPTTTKRCHAGVIDDSQPHRTDACGEMAQQDLVVEEFVRG